MIFWNVQQKLRMNITSTIDAPNSIEIRWHSKNVNAHALIKYRSQYVEADLNKKSCSSPKITTAWKSILYRSKITLYWNPRKSGMYYEFSKNDILLMQQLKVLVASSIKTVLWNARFSRILIYGYFEPIWDTLSCCGSL